ncbi:MAG: fatty acid desaturase [Myxococcales bacterium]|nr:fatty acid desaturase [Myxococcales bacterium]MCB9530929.1 fatty acid desaturase [Myxococcales bacterium]MCB9534531.1 fatty acid desaturase [Myxococcales bacterium]
MLKYAADRRTLFFVALYYVAFAALWAVDPQAPLAKAAGIAFVAWLSWTCAVITHNTIHCPIFKNRRLNKAFQIVLTLAYGHPVSAYVPGHNLSHHKYAQQDRDVMRTTKMRFRWNLLNGLLFLPTVAVAILKNDRAFIRQMRGSRPRWYRQLIIESVVFGLVSIALLALDVRARLAVGATGAGLVPWNFVLYWYVPHLWAAFGIITINYLQHDGCDEDHPYNHSRNFVSPLFGWFTFNNGFHAIHHMHANLHWSLCADAHRREVAPNNDPRLDEPSIVAYIWRTFFWPGRRVRFDGTPVELPARRPDVSWVPTDGLGDDVSLGAAG